MLLTNILLLIGIGAVYGDEYSYTIIVPPGKVECYFHPVLLEKYHSFELDYQVIGGGSTDINFYVMSPKGVRVISDVNRNDGAHRVMLDDANAGRGDYSFCFDNGFSLRNEKRVFFEFFLMDAAGQFLGGFDEKIIVSAESLRELGTHIDTFQKVTTSVKDNLNKVERIQRQYSSLELADRAALEQSFEQINFWSSIHLGVMLFAVFVQVFMVRSLFEDNSKVGRILRKGKFND
uniref:GOLD domain-containing protein n=1 Tax=Syphacia muris TaxID=451379 RepID=A0A0N5AZH7_9BILA